MLITRAATEPVRTGLSYADRWEAADGGLITAWERGRELAQERPELAAAAQADELPELPWRGGAINAPSETTNRQPPLPRPGVLLYLAMWQGLRNEPLHIDTSRRIILTCARTGARARFGPEPG